MTVTLIVEETTLKGGDNIVEQIEYDFPIVVEDGNRYIGIEENGKYDIFKGSTVTKVINPTGCVSMPTESDGSALNRTNTAVDNSMTVNLNDLKKPVRNVIRVLVTDYSVVHGNTQTVKP